MRSVMITNTAIDLMQQDAPFLPGYSVTFVNATGNSATVQTSDAQAGTYANLVTVPAGEARTAVLNNRWIRLSAAGTVIALGN